MKDIILQNTFRFALNMNDTFHYACADVGEVTGDDMEDLIPLVDEFEYDTFVAYEALNRGYDPQIQDHLTDRFYKAKKRIKEIVSKEEGCFDLKEILDTRKEEVDLFGEEIIYKSFNFNGIVQSIACLEKNKLSVTGSNRYQARKKLFEIYQKDKDLLRYK